MKPNGRLFIQILRIIKQIYVSAFSIPNYINEIVAFEIDESLNSSIIVFEDSW